MIDQRTNCIELLAAATPETQNNITTSQHRHTSTQLIHKTFQTEQTHNTNQ